MQYTFSPQGLSVFFSTLAAYPETTPPPPTTTTFSPPNASKSLCEPGFLKISLMTPFSIYIIFLHLPSWLYFYLYSFSCCMPFLHRKTSSAISILVHQMYDVLPYPERRNQQEEDHRGAWVENCYILPYYCTSHERQTDNFIVMQER